MSKFKGSYQVEDGYVCGSRPQYFSIEEHDFEEDMSDEDLARFYEESAEEAFRQNIYISIERCGEFVAWARAAIEARKTNE